MSNIHVIFGTGPVGRAVMQELVSHGQSVRMVNRRGEMPDVPPGVEVRAGDAYQREVVRELTRDATIVYQCAQPAYTQWAEKFPTLQAAILEGAAINGAKLVVADNLYMYGAPNGKPIHEAMPYAPHTRKGRTRAEMAEAALAAHQEGRARVVIGRASDFFGPYVLDSTMGERAIYPALEGKTASLVGNLDMPHTYTYIEDFAKALVLLGERDDAFGQAWHVPNDQPGITQRQFMNLVFEEIGLPPKMSGMGRMMMRIGGLFIPEARESVEMMYEFEKPFVVDSGKFERAFGVRATPLPEAIRRTVDWYRSNPRL